LGAMAAVWTRIYRHLWFREPLQFEGTPMFDSTRGTRAFTEDPSREEFWPVPVADLMPQICAALQQLD
ncbi:MAG TPA: hypothetical protein VN181_01145, partial [Thermoanaerobaculia bacterium]|nr:hypothetical protein [Thermoanaerobaculia bacterium]